MESHSQARLKKLVGLLALEAVASGMADAEVAEYAAQATVRALGTAPPGRDMDRRARAYFDGVLRRRLVRSQRGGVGAARVVVDAVVADLRAAGRRSEQVLYEIERAWSDKMPPELLAYYRQELCA